MKIRTDFVTNSSSSSYAVEIAVKTTDGKRHNVWIAPDDGGGNGEADLTCTAQEIMKSNSLDSLFELLINSLYVDESNYDWYYPDAEKSLLNMKEKIGNIDKIDSLEFKRTLSAWGEFSNCFGVNLEYYAPKILELSKRVCESDGEEKEKAKKELEEYLNNFDGKINGEGPWFPMHFLGSEESGIIEWKGIAADIESFAKKAIKEKLPCDDNAEESTVIDMKNKTITQKAVYILKEENDEDYYG